MYRTEFITPWIRMRGWEVSIRNEMKRLDVVSLRFFNLAVTIFSSIFLRGITITMTESRIYNDVVENKLLYLQSTETV